MSEGRRTSHHPDEFDLELARTGEAGPQVVAHIDSCWDCQRRAEALDAVAHKFRQAAPPQEIPELVAARLTRAAREATRSDRRNLPRWVPVVVAAALVIATTWILRGPTRSPETTATTDVNRDGVTDILDALRLAQRIDGAEGLADSWDLDGNGRIDRGDADTIAAVVVRLSEEPTQ